jgi:hypothetical protein
MAEFGIDGRPDRRVLQVVMRSRMNADVRSEIRPSNDRIPSVRDIISARSRS